MCIKICIWVIITMALSTTVQNRPEVRSSEDVFDMMADVCSDDNGPYSSGVEKIICQYKKTVFAIRRKRHIVSAYTENDPEIRVTAVVDTMEIRDKLPHDTKSTIVQNRPEVRISLRMIESQVDFKGSFEDLFNMMLYVCSRAKGLCSAEVEEIIRQGKETMLTKKTRKQHIVSDCTQNDTEIKVFVNNVVKTKNDISQLVENHTRKGKAEVLESAHNEVLKSVTKWNTIIYSYNSCIDNKNSGVISSGLLGSSSLLSVNYYFSIMSYIFMSILINLFN